MPVWLKITLLVLVAAQVAYAYVRPRLRSGARRQLEKNKPTAIAALRSGELETIAGVVAARGAMLTSPVGGKACIGFWTSVDHKPSHGAGEVWLPVARREACGPFTVTDASGTVVVEGSLRLELDPADSAWANLPSAVYSFLEQQGLSDTAFLGDNPVRFQEAVLKPGDRVRVRGRLSVTGSIRGSSTDPVEIIDDEEPLV